MLAQAEVYEELAAAGDQAHELSASDMAALLETCARMRKSLDEPIRSVITELVERPHELGLTEVASCCWSLATLDWPNTSAVFQVLGDRALQLVPEMDLHLMSTIAWAFAVRDERHNLFEPSSPLWQRFLDLRNNLTYADEVSMHQTLRA